MQFKFTAHCRRYLNEPLQSNIKIVSTATGSYACKLQKRQRKELEVNSNIYLFT